MRLAATAFTICILALTLACGPAPAAQQPATAAPASAPSAPKTEAKPAAAPAVQPAKPAAPQAAPAAQPAKPAAQQSAPTQKRRIFYGSSQSGTPYYILSVGVAKLWNTKIPEVEVTNVESGGCFENVRRMEQNEMQAGVSCPDLTYRAWLGIEEFKDKPVQVQRFIYIQSAGPQGLLVRKDSGIAKLEELNGKDWAAGNKGSGTEKQVQAMLDVLGIKPRYYAGGNQDLIQAIKDRRIVGTVRLQPGTKGTDGPTMEIAVTTPLDMVGFTPEQEKKVLEKFPFYSFMTVEKDRFAPGFPSRTVRTPALVVGVTIHKDISEDLAYKITKVTIEDNTEKGEKLQALTNPALVGGVDFVKLTLDYTITPLHAGAVRYYKELGKEIKPELIPPELKR